MHLTDTDREARCAELLQGLLRNGRARVAALAADGFRIAVPSSLGVPGGRLIPLPAGRETMIDLVVPRDRLRVLGIWERAGARGHAAGPVEVGAVPGRPAVLTILDARRDHGVWVAALHPADGPGPDVDEAPAGSLAVPFRTRTAVLRKSFHAVVTEIDDRVTSMLGWTWEAMVGRRSSEFVHPDDLDRVVTSWMELVAHPELQRVRYRHLRADGGWLWVESESVMGTTGGGDPEATTTLSDISEEMAAHEAVIGRERLFRRLTEALPIGLLRVEPGGTISYRNAGVGRLFGDVALDVVEDLSACLAFGDRPALRAALAAAIGAGRDRELEVALRPLPGRSPVLDGRRCSISLIALTDREGAAGTLVCLQDVTDSARLRDDLLARATFDALTGAHNRASVLGALDHEIATAPLGSTGVLYVDLDGFKAVNDERGHAVGDELLVEVADRLRSVVRPGDLVGRIGGDEFLLLLTGLDGPVDAAAVADRALAVLRGDVALTGGTIRLRASVGMACTVAGDTRETLVDRADAAMYRDKALGPAGPTPPLRDPTDATAHAGLS